MGISKSLKRIFGKKKKDFGSSDIGSDTSIKSPKNTRKGGTSQVIRKVSNLKSTGYDPRMGIIPYGAYNPSNAKLVTAASGYPSNYEHYSNFEPKALAQSKPKLTGVNMEDANIYESRNLYNGMYSSQILNTSGHMSQSTTNYEHYSVPRRRTPLRSNSLCDIRSDDLSSQDNIPRQVVQRRAGSALQRRSSNCSIQGGVPYSNSHSQFYSMYQKNNQYSTFNRNFALPNQIPSSPPHAAVETQKFSEFNLNIPQDPRHLEATVRKMETYLALLNQIQSQMGNGSSETNRHPVPRINTYNSVGVSQTNEVKRPILKQNKPVQRSRSTLQPQPDFQEREARKKRKLRRNKDSLAFDLTALKKRLEIISLEENEPDKIGSCGSINSDQSSEISGRVKSDCSESDKKSDIGYNSGNSGLTTPEKEKSDNSGDDSFNSGDDSSDSGLSTPPFSTDSMLFSKKLPNTLKTSKQNDEIFKRRIIGRTRTKSE